MNWPTIAAFAFVNLLAWIAVYKASVQHRRSVENELYRQRRKVTDETQDYFVRYANDKLKPYGLRLDRQYSSVTVVELPPLPSMKQWRTLKKD